jgi:hypothetical protein
LIFPSLPPTSLCQQGRQCSLLRVLALVDCTVPHALSICPNTYLYGSNIHIWQPCKKWSSAVWINQESQKNDWKLWLCLLLLWALVLRVPAKHIAWVAMQTTYSASCSNGTAKFRIEKNKRHQETRKQT